MRHAMTIAALLAAVAVTSGCDDKKAAGDKPKTDKPKTEKPADKVDKSKIKVTEDYLPDAQKNINAENLDDTVSKLEDEILTDGK